MTAERHTKRNDAIELAWQTEEDITLQDLAKRFNVTPGRVWQIINGYDTNARRDQERDGSAPEIAPRTAVRILKRMITYELQADELKALRLAIKTIERTYK